MGRSGLHAAAAAGKSGVWRRLLGGVPLLDAAVRYPWLAGLSGAGEPHADAGPRRLCRRGAGVGSTDAAGRVPLSAVGHHSLLRGRTVRDGLRPDHHRRHHSGLGGDYAAQHPLLAQRDPVDGRYGRAGAVPCADAPSGRRRLLPDEGGKPRPHQVQAGAPCGRHRQDPLHHLYRADGGGGRGAADRGHGMVRRGEPRLYHHGHRRLLCPQHLHRLLSIRRHHMGHRSLYVSGGHQFLAAVRRCPGTDQGRPAQRGAAVVSADFGHHHHSHLR